jgi:hypothetical protein
MGRVDTVLSSDDPDEHIELGDGITAAARFAWIGVETDGSIQTLVVGGTSVRLPHGELRLAQAKYEGVIHDFARQEAGPTWLDVEADLPTDGRLQGAELRVLGASPRDTCYRIEGVTAVASGLQRLDLGDTTLVRGFIDDQQYDGGLSYDVDVGDAFEILGVARCRVGPDGCEILAANVEVGWSAALSTS